MSKAGEQFSQWTGGRSGGAAEEDESATASALTTALARRPTSRAAEPIDYDDANFEAVANAGTKQDLEALLATIRRASQQFQRSR